MEPSTYQITTELRDGTKILIRAIRPEDRESLRAQFAFLSPESVRLRFHGVRRSPTKSEATALTEVDFVEQVALVATLQTQPAQLIGGTRYIICDGDTTSHRAEIAFVVLDQYQGKGIGSLLLKHLAKVGKAQGITEFQADVLVDNYRMMRVLEHSGFPVARSTQSGVVRLLLTIGEPQQSDG